VLCENLELVEALILKDHEGVWGSLEMFWIGIVVVGTWVYVFIKMYHCTLGAFLCKYYL
jgi:hypothetical protein